MEFIDLSMSSRYRMQPYVGTQVEEAKLPAMEGTDKTKWGRQRYKDTRISFLNLHKGQGVRFIGFFRVK